MTDQAPFRYPLQIHSDDIDALGHVNNVVYVRWVQEVAAAHWQKMATPEQQQSMVWVVLRHEIDYHAPALPGDSIEGSTRVGNYQGARFERYVYLRQAHSGKLLAEAKTIWCLLDGATKRPVRVTPELALDLQRGNVD